ncbi:hypothetical protein AAZV13_13G257400 [Glycine max]
MENGSEKWNFQGNKKLNASSISVRGAYNMLMERVNNSRDKKPLMDFIFVISLQRKSPWVTFNVLLFQFAKYLALHQMNMHVAIANYLSSDLPYQLSPENVFLTIGGTQAIDIILPVLARPGANILLPRPGYPQYDSRASCCWEVDLDSLEVLADENSVATVLINSSNPCGSVFTYQHLEREHTHSLVAEISRKLGIFVISDEIYAPVTYGNNPFVPMGVFSSIVPVITIGSLSKRWLVPGWRTGWIATCDPHGIFQKTGVVKKIISYLEITIDPPTFLQAAIPEILGKTKDEFLSKNLNILRGAANIFYDLCKEILCLTCPHKPVGAMCVMVEINFSQIKDIVDEMDFCAKLAEEESVLLPGVTVGLKNWLRISFAVHTSNLVEGLNRIKAFCLIYAKMPRSYVSW